MSIDVIRDVKIDVLLDVSNDVLLDVITDVVTDVVTDVLIDVFKNFLSCGKGQAGKVSYTPFIHFATCSARPPRSAPFRACRRGGNQCTFAIKLSRYFVKIERKSPKKANYPEDGRWIF